MKRLLITAAAVIALGAATFGAATTAQDSQGLCISSAVAHVLS